MPALKETAAGITGALAQHGRLLLLIHHVHLDVVEVELVANQVHHQVEQGIRRGALAGGEGDALAGLQLAGAFLQFGAAGLHVCQQGAYLFRHLVEAGGQHAGFVA